MANMLRTFEGLRPAQVGTSVGLEAPVFQPRQHCRRLEVLAQRKVKKTQQVILKEDVPNIGKKGELTNVINGYWRNYLRPMGMAVPATEGILSQIQRKIEAEEQRKRDETARAKAMATALATIGKFAIKKKVGDADQIFGSVTAADVVAAIEQQTGRSLDKKLVELPEISTLGTYEASIRLHPEVSGVFKLVIVKDKTGL